MKYFYLILVVLIGISCQTHEPREPVVKRSGQFLKRSSKLHKAIQKRQEKEIYKIIKQDSLHHYHVSPNGFWYRYDQKNNQDTLKPEFGDLVNFNYNITTLDGQPIYTQKEIGTQEYKMDQEDLFSGLRNGLKLMKEEETVTFYFPSSVAFDYYGDRNKIGHNVPIRATVTLNSIKKNEN
ncbi:MAG TPA: gliding motility-associated peptidyl-prolyl isomerase GldI [Flavobacteriaceae bacterium]|nr:gliding motility-associated peptidyl-prolyl isomerase GldI [Flavobacteriaceae bacterium]